MSNAPSPVTVKHPRQYLGFGHNARAAFWKVFPNITTTPTNDCLCGWLKSLFIGILF